MSVFFNKIFEKKFIKFQVFKEKHEKWQKNYVFTKEFIQLGRSSVKFQNKISLT